MYMDSIRLIWQQNIHKIPYNSQIYCHLILTSLSELCSALLRLKFDAQCLSLTGPTVAHLEVSISPDYM